MIRNRQSILFIGDVIALCMSLILMIFLRFDYVLQKTIVLTHIKTFSLLFIVWLVIFFVFDLYTVQKVNPSPRNIGLLLSAIGVASGLSIIAFYVFSPVGVTPKTNLLIVATISFVLLILWRRLFYSLFTSRFRQRIALVGRSSHIDTLQEKLKGHPPIGSVVAIWPDYVSANYSDACVDILISESLPAQEFMLLSKKFKTQPRTLAQAYESLFAKVPIDLMNNEKALFILTKEHHQGTIFLYRVIEIVMSFIIICVTFPFLCLAMLAIYIEDGGPIFYSQARVGKDGKLFSIIKLRSMKKDAEKNGIQWAQHDDNRVTRVGAVIRKLHIDEIPQMYNIIQGHLALVGPRPERPSIVATLEQEIPYYFLRHAVRPGFTGWAQIKFRYARTIEDSKEKFEYDLYYLLNKHPILDIGIVLKTVQIIFTH